MSGDLGRLPDRDWECLNIGRSEIVTQRCEAYGMEIKKVIGGLLDLCPAAAADTKG